MIDVTSDSQFICFAKGHFEKGEDWFGDLCKIHAEVYMVPEESVTMCDLRNVLMHLAHKMGCFDKSWKFSEFLDDISPYNYYRWVGGLEHMGRLHPLYDYDKAVVHKCLSMIALTSVYDDDDNIKILFNPADPKIMPVKERMKGKGTNHEV